MTPLSTYELGPRPDVPPRELWASNSCPLLKRLVKVSVPGVPDKLICRVKRSIPAPSRANVLYCSNKSAAELGQIGTSGFQANVEPISWFKAAWLVPEARYCVLAGILGALLAILGVINLWIPPYYWWKLLLLAVPALGAIIAFVQTARSALP